MSFTNNYSQVTINEVIKNFEFLTDSTSISDRSFHLAFKLSQNLDMLELQAVTFAENFKSHGYINFFKTLRIPENQVYDALHDLYIYSYAKCLYNGLNYSTISEQSYMGYAFRGHSSLFYLMRSPGNSTKYQKLYLSWNLDIGDESYKQALLLNLISQYPFLKSYREYSKDTYGTKPFMIQKFEAYFNFLTEDYYSRDNVQQGEQQNKSEGPRAFNNAPSGKICVIRMDPNHVSSMLSFSLNPIMNAFLSANGSKFYFVPVGNGKQVENNASLFFSKANFIQLEDENSKEMTKVKRIYRSIKVNDDLIHTVCSEVFTNTGIICRFLSTKIPKKTTLLPLDEIKDRISSFTGKTPREVFDIIMELIKENADLDRLMKEAEEALK
jgi:hypothetical protein